MTLVERGTALATSSRASTFHPSTLDLLAPEGIRLDEDPGAVRVSCIQWRDSTGAVRAQLDYRLLEGMTRHPFRLHLDQQALLDRLAVLLAADPRVDFFPGLSVEALDPAGPSVTALSAAGEMVTFGGDLVVGCDGAGSAVRSLAGIAFSTDDYPTGAVRAYVRSVPEDSLPSAGEPLCALCYFRDGGDGVSLLRMHDEIRLVVRTTGEQEDDVRIAEALAAATPWSAGELEIDRVDGYRLQRGVADSYMPESGRVLVLGDAAHLTSTAGGLNMNSGIHDAFALMPAVGDWLHGRCRRPVVEEVAAARRDYLLGSVIPRSERRVRGVEDPDGDAVSDYLDEISAIAADPAAARRFLSEDSLLDSPMAGSGWPVGAR